MIVPLGGHVIILNELGHGPATRRIRMPSIGPTEIIIVLVIVILLFGVGRIGKIGGELGKSIREFRRGIQGDEAEKKSDPNAK
jgi:sec-independent protein translocase protein TatA